MKLAGSENQSTRSVPRDGVGAIRGGLRIELGRLSYTGPQ